MTTISLVHGAWHGAWYWDRLTPGHSPFLSRPRELAEVISGVG